MKVYLNGDNDQPTTCPECGSRTEFDQVNDYLQQHECLQCSNQFLIEFDTEEI